MYKLVSFSESGAVVTNTDTPYASTFMASTLEDAEKIVIGLNRPDMLAELADYRFQFETGGLNVGGLAVKTDRESQAQLSSAFVTLSAGLVPDTDWKGASAWEVVNLDQIKPIAKAVAAHVRGCFRGERLVEAAIKGAQTMADIETIDIRANFAAAYEAAFAEVMQPAGA